MNKNAIILAGLCIFGLCTWQAPAMSLEHVSINNTEDNHIPTGADEIRLIGKLDCNAGPDDIEAGATDNAVYLSFNQNFGNVDIKIYNALGGLIYNNVVDTSMQQYVVIPITSVVNGTYTVVLSNANGYAEGDFEKE